MNPRQADRHLGEYLLTELVEENSITRTWLAEQASVARKVWVQELTDIRQQENFLADVRAKAAVDHPLIASVYEAVSQPGLCFCAHELLPGATLHQASLRAETFLPIRLVQILHKICDANLQFESVRTPANALNLDAIHVDSAGTVRLKNLATAGSRAPECSTRDIAHLGSALLPLLASDKPGTTRVLTLLSWMRGEGIDAPLSWAAIRDFCEQIEQQLAAPLPSSSGTQITAQASSRKNRFLWILAALGAVAAFAGASFLLPTPEAKPQPVARAVIPPAVTIPAGTYSTQEGTRIELPSFRITAHEVTIGEYSEFLDALQMLAKSERHTTFDHQSQPPDKISHQPKDWEKLMAAVETQGLWQGRPVTLDSPVIGIDWWDATAYAEWKNARLPSQEEWFAAASHPQTTQSRLADLPASPWAPLDSPSQDRTPAGLLAMAGSVSEWTRSQAPNPDNPLGEKLWVIAGGSHLKAGSNALTREWTADRALRRADLGFRLVFEQQ